MSYWQDQTVQKWTFRRMNWSGWTGMLRSGGLRNQILCWNNNMVCISQRICLLRFSCFFQLKFLLNTPYKSCVLIRRECWVFYASRYTGLNKALGRDINDILGDQPTEMFFRSSKYRPDVWKGELFVLACIYRFTWFTTVPGRETRPARPSNASSQI